MDVRWIHSGTAKVDKALLGISLFLALAGLYYLSPVVELTDSRYTMLVSEHLLLRGNLAVDEHFWPYSNPATTLECGQVGLDRATSGSMAVTFTTTTLRGPRFFRCLSFF